MKKFLLGVVSDTFGRSIFRKHSENKVIHKKLMIKICRNVWNEVEFYIYEPKFIMKIITFLTTRWRWSLLRNFPPWIIHELLIERGNNYGKDFTVILPLYICITWRDDKNSRKCVQSCLLCEQNVNKKQLFYNKFLFGITFR